MHTTTMQTNRFEIKKWSSMSFKLQIDKDLNSGEMHLWSKFGNCNFNLWWLIVRTNSKWGKFLFEVQFDVEGQGQSPPKTIEILTKVFYNSGPNFVILAWTGDKL